MFISHVLHSQWNGYSRYHCSRANLALHIAVVPIFLLANIGLLVALLRGAWPATAACVIAMVLSVALQGKGHGKEHVPPEPFTGVSNAITRIFLEQWVTFPRFVVSGAWAKAWRESIEP